MKNLVSPKHPTAYNMFKQYTKKSFDKIYKHFIIQTILISKNENTIY